MRNIGVLATQHWGEGREEGQRSREGGERGREGGERGKEREGKRGRGKDEGGGSGRMVLINNLAC